MSRRTHINCPFSTNFELKRVFYRFVAFCVCLSVSGRVCASQCVSGHVCACLCMSLRVWACLWVFVRVCVCLGVSVHVCACLCVSVRACARLCVPVRVCALPVHACTCLYLSVRVCARLFVFLLRFDVTYVKNMLVNLRHCTSNVMVSWSYTGSVVTNFLLLGGWLLD